MPAPWRPGETGGAHRSPVVHTAGPSRPSERRTTALGDRVGRRRVLWAAVLVALAGAWITVPDDLVAALAGLLLVTVGFFGTHSLASGWVGRRSSSLPGGTPAVASSLYLLAYYAGSRVGGWVGGWVGGLAYDGARWPGLVGYVSALLLGAGALALALRRIPAA